MNNQEKGITMQAELLTLDEVAAILRISNSTVYRLIHDLNLPAIKIGKMWRFEISQFENWLNSQKQNDYLN